jgi:hypothetical protein
MKYKPMNEQMGTFTKEGARGAPLVRILVTIYFERFLVYN